MMTGLFLHPPAWAEQATISWDPSMEPTLSGYKVHYGTASRQYAPPVDVGNVTSRVFTNLTTGTVYYFALSSYDVYGQESGLSSEAVYYPGSSNNPPTDIGLSGTSVVDKAPAGTEVGAFETTDPDAGNTFTYSLSSGSGGADNMSFRISGNALQTDAVFDLSVRSSYSIRVRSTDQGGLAVEKVFTIAVLPPSYVLWSRSDTGQAALWRIDPVDGTLLGSIWLNNPSGIGAPWLATGFRQSGATGYVLWTRSDTGQAALWKVDPETGELLSSSYLHSPRGVGGTWQAAGYEHVNDTTGYVLWTRGDTGQAALWKIDPSVTGTIPILDSSYVYSPRGVGKSWRATDYQHVSDTTGYVLWSRSDTGQAALWKIDPSATGTKPILCASYLHSSSGVGGPWLATGYQYVNDTTGYVLWTRSDTGLAALWKINPESATGIVPLVSSTYLHTSSGVGGPWQATDYSHSGP